MTLLKDVKHQPTQENDNADRLIIDFNPAALPDTASEEPYFPQFSFPAVDLRQLRHALGLMPNPLPVPEAPDNSLLGKFVNSDPESGGMFGNYQALEELHQAYAPDLPPFDNFSDFADLASISPVSHSEVRNFRQGAQQDEWDTQVEIMTDGNRTDNTGIIQTKGSRVVHHQKGQSTSHTQGVKSEQHRSQSSEWDTMSRSGPGKIRQKVSAGYIADAESHENILNKDFAVGAQVNQPGGFVKFPDWQLSGQGSQMVHIGSNQQTTRSHTTETTRYANRSTDFEPTPEYEDSLRGRLARVVDKVFRLNEPQPLSSQVALVHTRDSTHSTASDTEYQLAVHTGKEKRAGYQHQNLPGVGQVRLSGNSTLSIQHRSSSQGFQVESGATKIHVITGKEGADLGSKVQLPGRGRAFYETQTDGGVEHTTRLDAQNLAPRTAWMGTQALPANRNITYRYDNKGKYTGLVMRTSGSFLIRLGNAILGSLNGSHHDSRTVGLPEGGSVTYNYKGEIIDQQPGGYAALYDYSKRK